MTVFGSGVANTLYDGLRIGGSGTHKKVHYFRNAPSVDTRGAAKVLRGYFNTRVPTAVIWYHLRRQSTKLAHDISSSYAVVVSTHLDGRVGKH